MNRSTISVVLGWLHKNCLVGYKVTANILILAGAMNNHSGDTKKCVAFAHLLSRYVEFNNVEIPAQIALATNNHVCIGRPLSIVFIQ